MRWMRVALVLGLLLCASKPAQATIAFVASSSAGSATAGNFSGAASMNSTGANFLACALSDYNANTPSTITETTSGGGTNVAPTGYTTVTSVTLVQVRLAYWVNPVTGNPTSFSTTNASNSYPAIACIALSGVDTTAPFESESAGGTSTATTVQPGSRTPVANDAVLISVLGTNVDTSESINSGYSTPVTGGAVVGTSFTASISYLILVGAGTAQNPTWTGADASGRGARQAVFIPSGGGGGGGTVSNLSLTGMGK